MKKTGEMLSKENPFIDWSLNDKFTKGTRETHMDTINKQYPCFSPFLYNIIDSKETSIYFLRWIGREIIPLDQKTKTKQFLQ